MAARSCSIPPTALAYSRLCRLLSVGKSRAGKARCELSWDDLALWSEGLIAMMIPDRANGLLRMQLIRLRDIFGANATCALTLRRRPRDHMRLHEIAQMAAGLDIPTVATNDVLFHAPDRRILQDVVTCIREKTTIDAARLQTRTPRRPPFEIARRNGTPVQAVAGRGGAKR